MQSIDFLTDLERTNLEVALENSVLMDAFKKVLSDAIVNQGVQRQGEDSQMGRNWVFYFAQHEGMTPEEKTKAILVRSDALILLERAFEDIKALKKEEDKPEKTKNPAR